MSFSKPGAALAHLSLKGRALRLLSGREYARLELERKLAGQEETPGELAQVLDELEAKGFISEQRVVESVVNRKQAKQGTALIKRELTSRGLDSEMVAAAVAQLQQTELERARAVWLKKFDHLPTDAASRGKQMRFLASRGFGSEAIGRVLRGAAEED